jgi:hypothetical protein
MANRNDSPKLAEGCPLNPSEIGVLKACHEVVTRQQELLPLLAKAVGVPEREVWYTWAFRRCKQSGRVGESGWSYFFHGIECDLKHADGRFLRLDFGPKGRMDTFTAWGVLQFIMTSAPPWSEFVDLKQHLAERGPPFNELSGSFSKMVAIWAALEARGAFEPADPELVAFQARYTTIGPEGITYVTLPPGTSDEVQVDCMVAHRPILSAVGHHLLDANAGIRAA